MTCRVAIVKWSPTDEIGAAIQNGLGELGYQTVFFEPGGAIPKEIDELFSFGPYGPFPPVPRQLADLLLGERPFLVHWNTEQISDLHIPWTIVTRLGALRSWGERMFARFPFLNPILVLARLPSKITPFRYVGDYYYAHHQGWLDLLVESSDIYASLHRREGLNVIFVPWGTAADWHANLHVERDIDVLWIGKRRTRRRSLWIDRIRSGLADCGLMICVVQKVERRFVYEEERTSLLSRSKIKLNLLPKWHDEAFSYRHHVAAANRTLVVSEPIASSCPRHRAGISCVSVPVSTMYCLEYDREWQAITNAAHQLVTARLRFPRSVRIIMETAEKLRGARRGLCRATLVPS